MTYNKSMQKTYYVFIKGNQKPVLYIGVTGDLIRRVYEHKNDLAESFSKTYQTHKLLYVESTSDVVSAIAREKQLKHWNRDWKLRLIKEANPTFKDLYNNIIK